MSQYLELQEFTTDGDNAFKSCENLLLKDSVLSDDKVEDPVAENVPGEICQEISTCHDLNCTDHSLHELVDTLSSSNSPLIQKPDFLDVSLDDIPLTEQSNQGNPNDLLEILPEHIPDDKLLLLKIPDHLQDSNLLNEILDIQLDQSIIDEIEKSVKVSEGAFVVQDETENIIQEAGIEVVRRPPLQLIQQTIKFPVVKNARVDKDEEDLKAASKRKQYFEYPREDLVEFYSDEENNENSQKPEAITVNNDDDHPPSPKKVKLDEPIIDPIIIDEEQIIKDEEQIKIDEKPIKPTKSPNESSKAVKKKKTGLVIEKCPRCDKNFKKLSLHKCREPINGPIKTLKPSEVPLPLKCDSCKQFFPDKEAMDKHKDDKHSRITCKVCKRVMKNAQGLKLHSAKCGIDIQPVKKFVPKYDKKNSVN